jgi:hypothetical protein
VIGASSGGTFSLAISGITGKDTVFDRYLITLESTVVFRIPGPTNF